MDDVLVGRILIFILALIIGIWLVNDMSWKNKWHRLIFRISYVAFVIRGIGYFAFNFLGLFPLD